MMQRRAAILAAIFLCGCAAYLAAHLSGKEFPAFHFGTDVIRTPPRRFGLFRGNPPADAPPPADAVPLDGYGSVHFRVIARAPAPG